MGAVDAGLGLKPRSFVRAEPWSGLGTEVEWQIKKADHGVRHRTSIDVADGVRLTEPAGWAAANRPSRVVEGLPPSLHEPAQPSAMKSAQVTSAAMPLNGLVRQHLDFVWRLLRRLGLSASRADDLTQEVFLVAVRRQSELVVGCERAFLYGVAVRLAANTRRQLRRRREVVEGELEAMADAALPDENLDQKRLAQRLDALLDELPDKLRRVLVLSDVMELEVAEVAALEQIPEGTVASRLRRARQLLRRKVTSYRADLLTRRERQR
jgi:RNA polymerase sigma-70 factor (ECF subfamily)